VQKEAGISFPFFLYFFNILRIQGDRMNQMDMFYNRSEDYLYSELQKVKGSMDKRSRAIFALIAELQDQVIKMKEEKNR
jgi:hypothetical protein